MYIRIDDIAHTWCAVATGAAIPKVEAVFCYDLKDGAPLGSGLGTPNSVYIPDKALSAALDGQRVVKVVHSHPNGSENVSLSAVDLAALWNYAGVVEIDAVLLDGSWFRAVRPTESARPWHEEVLFALDAIRRATKAEARIERAICPDSSPDYALYNEVRTHVVCTALARLGKIYYETSVAQNRRMRWSAAQPLLNGWVDEVIAEYKRRNW